MALRPLTGSGSPLAVSISTARTMPSFRWMRPTWVSVVMMSVPVLTTDTRVGRIRLNEGIVRADATDVGVGGDDERGRLPRRAEQLHQVGQGDLLEIPT